MKRISYPAALAIVLAAQACGRNPMEVLAPTGAVVTGGTAGPAVTGGMQGTGGSHEDPSASGDCPPCIAAAINACLPAGECVSETHGSGMGSTSAFCYANGVRVTQGNSINGNNFTAHKTVILNGKTCYSEDQVGELHATNTITFGDGTGKQLATGTVSAAGFITVNCNGKEFGVGGTWGGRNDATNCRHGRCPEPKQ